VFDRNSKQLVYKHCEVFRSKVELKSTALSAVPATISNRHVHLQTLTLFILISLLSSNGCFWN